MGKTKTSFKAGNLAAEKWTEENALYLADELIEWMKKEAIMIDAPAGIAEMEVHPHTMAQRGEVQNIGEVT